MIFRKKKSRKIEKDDGVFVHRVVGEVDFRRSARATRILLTVRPPDGEVRLTMPPGIPFAEGLRFLESKADWVAAARKRIRDKSACAPVLPPYSTRGHTLVLRAAADSRIGVRVGGGEVSVACPAGVSADSEPVQNAIKRGIEEAWRIEAQTLLPRRVEWLAREHGFEYGAVAIRNTVSKWGSCSAHNDLSLSIHLMRLPDHLIDYVLLHELCHTVHHDHGAAFHALLGRHTDGRHLELRKELRNYRTRW